MKEKQGAPETIEMDSVRPQLREQQLKATVGLITKSTLMENVFLDSRGRPAVSHKPNRIILWQT